MSLPGRRGLGAVFFTAIALRLCLWSGLSPNPERFLRPDSGDYVQLAKNMVRHGEFSLMANGERVPETFRTPGYPAFLAAHFFFSQNLRLPALTQTLLDSMTAVLVALSAAILAPGAPAWGAGLLYALDPMAAAHSPLILSETLFTFFLTLSLYSALLAGRQGRAWPAAACGLCLGLAALTRPIALYLWIPWGAALAALWGLRRWKALTLYVLMATAPPGLWCARNAALFGHFEFTSISGASLLFYEAPALKAGLEGTSFSEASRRLRESFIAEHPAPFTDPFEESRLRREAAGRLLRAHPARVLRLHAVSAAKTLLGPGLDLLAEEFFPSAIFSKQESPADAVTGGGTRALLRQRPVLWLALGLTMALLSGTYCLVLYGIVPLWRSQASFLAATCLTPLGCMSALSLGGWSYYRFRVALWPFIAVLAAGGLERLMRHGEAGGVRLFGRRG